MTPFAGKGANVAMLSALKLAEAIVAARSTKDLERMIAEEERDMAELAAVDALETEIRLKKAMFTERGAEALIAHGEGAHTGNLDKDN